MPKGHLLLIPARVVDKILDLFILHNLVLQGLCLVNERPMEAEHLLACKESNQYTLGLYKS